MGSHLLSGEATLLPSREDIIDRLRDVIDLAAAWGEQIDDLLPRTRDEARLVWGAPSPGCIEDKVMAETAILFHLTHRACSEDPTVAHELREPQQRLLRMLVMRGRPRRHMHLLPRAPHTVWPVGLTHTILQRYGSADMQFDSLVENCLKLGWNDRVDRQIFRALEMCWASALREGHPPRVEELLRISSIDKALPSLVAAREDVYAFTHTLFYATDFGVYPLPKWVDREGVTSSLDSYLAWQMWEDDLDILCELLSNAYSCGLPSRYADIVLCAIWKDLCTPAVRGPFADKVRHKLNHPYDREVFGSCYHTTLVAGMLCASILSAPPIGNVRSHPNRELVDAESLACLTLVKQIPRLGAAWTTRIQDSVGTTENVVSCIMDGAATVAFRSGEWTATQDLQKRANRYAWGDTSTLAAIAGAAALQNS